MKIRIMAGIICFVMLFCVGCSTSSQTSSVSSQNVSSSASSSGLINTESFASSGEPDSFGSDASSDTSSKNSSAADTVSSKPSSSKNSSAFLQGESSLSNQLQSQPVDTTVKSPTHIIMMSDIHLEDYNNWYGMNSFKRIEKMTDDLIAFDKENPYDHLMILGDMSLDFWRYSPGGSYVNKGVSNTKNLIDNYLSKIDATKYYLPGNHEQYSHQKWKEITGYDRQYSVVIDGWLFIMLDAFSGVLDPDYDFDGMYVNMNVDFIKSEMAKHPNLPVVLCAHYFDINKENYEFYNLLNTEKRIVCLFEGHDHTNTIDTLPPLLGSKKVFHVGNFSYNKAGDSFENCSWGWRNLYLTEDSITIDYYTPKNVLNGATTVINAGVKQQAYEIKNPMK